MPSDIVEYINKRHPDNLNDYCEFIILDEPTNIKHFTSESDIKNHAIAIDTKIDTKIDLALFFAHIKQFA
jgi:hypothetical protein